MTDDDYYGDSRVVVHFGRYYSSDSDQPPASRRSWLWALLPVASVVALYIVLMLCWFGSTT